tara:strand:+ start:566 stop:1789 length:1224 start_codon:yes stop_codon:yes gene_type:complete
MKIDILMPALSPTMKEGNLTKWHVKIGDQIKAGDLIAEIETDKATMEIEAVDEGKITDILFQEGEEGIAVNSTIAVLNGDKKNTSVNKNIVKKEKNKSINKEIDNIISSNEIEKKDAIIKKNKNFLASPLAKKIAKEENIDLNTINGSGPNKRIIKRDLEKIENLQISEILSDNYKIIEPSSIRKIIAEKTTKTKNEVPHFYLKIDSEVDKLLKLRSLINNQNPNLNISINDILVKAVALAQFNNPITNASWDNGKIHQYSSVDVSIAVALNEGLVTPIIKNAHKKGLVQISREIKDLILKAKNGKLNPEEFSGGTISISNLGMYGIKEFSAIINSPQSSILAIGAIQKVPKEKNNELKFVNLLTSTLSADHRILDGAVAAKLLKDFNDIIENPFQLWLQSNDMEVL